MQDLVESVSLMNDSNNDWFLVAPDFTDYMRAQASGHPASLLLSWLDLASRLRCRVGCSSNLSMRTDDV